MSELKNLVRGLMILGAAFLCLLIASGLVEVLLKFPAIVIPLFLLLLAYAFGKILQ